MTSNEAATTAGELDQAGNEAANWFFENSLDVFLITAGGSLRRVNPAWTVLTGWSSQETVGQALASFIPEEDKTATAALRATLDATGMGHAEHRIRAKDGRLIWMRSRAKRGADGRALIVLQDITEERESAEAAEKARHARELLREAAGLYMWRFDPVHNTYIFDTETLPTRAPIGEDGSARPADDVRRGIHPEDVAELDKAWNFTLETGEFSMVEYRRMGPGGGYARFRTAWRGEYQAPSGEWEIIGVSQDITELANARDAAIQGEKSAQTAAEAKAQFLANMSHEIRTPLNGVLGVLHLLKSEPLGDEARGLLGEALACGAMLGELLNDVIDFSKIEAGRLELSPEPVDPAAALEEVASLLRPQAEAKNLYLRTHTDASVGWVSIDPVRLRQSLFNLIGNAVKFTLEGGVDVWLSASIEGGERRLKVEVQDTGIGIAPEAQGALFERFSQADGSTTRRFGGSGLGLSISRRLIELMGGKLGFSSAAGQGSTFWFELPALPVAAPVAEAADGALLLEGLRLLVVEDNRTNRLIISKMLENLGASVTVVEDGQQGVIEAERGGFDLIFMDIQMPVMDGVTATRAIRGLPGPVSHTPILAMTANALSHQTESYRQAGMDGSVAKPISPAALLAEMGRVFTEREAADDEALSSAAG